MEDHEIENYLRILTGLFRPRQLIKYART